MLFNQVRINGNTPVLFKEEAYNDDKFNGIGGIQSAA